MLVLVLPFPLSVHDRTKLTCFAMTLPTSVIAVTFSVVCLLAVSLRFVARARTKAGYGADDWFAVASLALFIGYASLVSYGVLYHHLTSY